MQVNNNVEINRFVDAQMGLTAEQVKQREQLKLTNTTAISNEKTVGQIIRENTFTFFNLVFVVLAILLLVVQSYKDLTFLPVVILNTVISIVQELRSRKALANLTMLNTETSTVLRGGQETNVATNDLVLDDVVQFKTGNQIPADAQIVSGELQVNEALLTGEADEITKKMNDQLMSGSFVVTGQAAAKLTSVGDDAYISKLTAQAKQLESRESSAMIQSLNRLIKIIGLILVPIGIALFAQSYFWNGNSLKVSIVSMEAALVGMIPEGLYLLTTVALALSAIRLAKKQVLLHNMKSIETLARVTVLCVDKTGTITENEMAVSRMVKAKNAMQEEGNLQTLLSDFCQQLAGDNSTMAALQKYFTTKSDRLAQKTIPFGSAWKFSGITFEGISYVLGAPEMVLRQDFTKYVSEFEEYTSQGYRVLVFGQSAEELTDHKLQAEVTPLAYILLTNPVRATAPQTFQYFANQGVQVKVISGDNPETVSSVALSTRIKGAENYVDASTLTPEDYESALQSYTVFGRVTPEQKQQFVQVLQQHEVVAMTGDGINDILAMKKADCSIAMASGNEATMHAAQMVLLDSDFSKMPEVVSEGRQVVNNIERSASLFLVKNIFSLLMAVFTLLFAFNYPLSPANITLISLFTIGLPSFLLALEPNDKQISGRFLTNIFRRSLPGGLTDTIVVSVIVVCGSLFGLYTSNIAVATVMIMSAVGFLVLYRISMPLNSFRRKTLLLCIVGLIAVTGLFGNFFGVSTISAVSLGFAAVLFLMADSILSHMTKLVEYLFDKFSTQLERILR
ncbi:HAD-IC family P-type ATPase [Levilactobacillus brevis]|uniref:HAD-IC family P-type ATPase n=1 Tax=Levilactobacillus brevis TaxID=1580 RepID=UPI00111A4E29|nr:HAD-IC family P-type ATPase [Levilactobacillus brevis]QCZ46837.1 hypothetical protein UCCLB556_1962 [Levilactobacillus brevis]